MKRKSSPTVSNVVVALYTATPRQHMMLLFTVMSALALFASPAEAALPWETAVCTVANSLAGTTAKAIAVIAVVVCGLLLAFGEMNGIFKTFLGLLMGVSMALMAAQWVGVISEGDSSFCGA